MEWFFFESMWTPVIAGILVGSCAFALDGIDNFFGAILLVFAAAICGVIGGVFAFSIMLKIGIGCFAGAVVMLIALFTAK